MIIFYCNECKIQITEKEAPHHQILRHTLVAYSIPYQKTMNNGTYFNPCCGRVPTTWNGKEWKCSECGSVVEYMEQLDIFVAQPSSKNKVCDCGGEKAKTTHANWCSKGNG